MIELRPFNSLGGANHGWLNAKHHFSFANYHDASRMNWGDLRVWNDDVIAPHTGFRRIPTATWKSSPMSAKARSPIRTTLATRAAPRRAMCR
jgi:hypothetical protein